MYIFIANSFMPVFDYRITFVILKLTHTNKKVFVFHWKTGVKRWLWRFFFIYKYKSDSDLALENSIFKQWSLKVTPYTTQIFNLK